MPGAGGGGSFSVTLRVHPGRADTMVEATLSRGLDWRVSVDYVPVAFAPTALGRPGEFRRARGRVRLEG
jgi:hypothetical protein